MDFTNATDNELGILLCGLMELNYAVYSREDREEIQRLKQELREERGKRARDVLTHWKLE